MTPPLDWTKPLRFTKVQDDDHVTYKPKYVGSFTSATGSLLHVVATRPWPDRDSQFGFTVYTHDGKPTAHEATNSTGIFNAALVNGPEIKTVIHDINENTRIAITYEGDTPVKVKLA